MAGGPPAVPVKSSSREVEIIAKGQADSEVGLQCRRRTSIRRFGFFSCSKCIRDSCLFARFDRKKRIDGPRWSRYISTVERKCLPMEEVLR